MNRMETRTDNEIIAEFMGWERYSSNAFKCPNIYPIENSTSAGWTTFTEDQLQFGTSWDWLMPVVTLLLNKLRLENWSTREASEWAEVHRKHVERRLFDYIYDDNTSQYDLVAEISSAIRWYNSNKQVANVVEECLQERKNQPQKAS